MSEIRKFRITGEIRKGKTSIPFSVEYPGMKQEHALQRLYAEMGSRHRARRFEINVAKIEETKQESS